MVTLLLSVSILCITSIVSLFNSTELITLVFSSKILADLITLVDTILSILDAKSYSMSFILFILSKTSFVTTETVSSLLIILFIFITI